VTADRAPVDDREVLRHILANTDVLLLDFDGPVCSIFSSIPAHYVARQLRDVLADGGHTDLPAEIDKTDDPFDLLHYAATLGQDEAHHVEAALRAQEVEAVATAEQTPGAHQLIRSWSSSRGKVGIVSNNSKAAVKTYLRLHDLADVVFLVSARTSPDPSLLKPTSHLVDQAVNLAGVQPEQCTLVGDSPSDMHAARNAGVRSVGYANKPGKLTMLSEARADAVIHTITALKL
jgi:HAD superfamily hydrolase (TIGR01549 family)